MVGSRQVHSDTTRFQTVGKAMTGTVAKTTGRTENEEKAMEATFAKTTGRP